MKKRVYYFLKLCTAGIISLILLSLFSLVYYNPPLATVQPEQITNYKFVEDSRWSYMLEGFGYGKTDVLGYNSAYYDNGSKPDIVCIGSSHLEALQVPQTANCVYLLNEKFDKDELPYNDFRCLNLGVSGHFFEVSASYFEQVVERFKEAKYIVIEASDVKFSSSQLDEILKGGFHSPLEEKGFLHTTLQRIPYVRLLYKKMNEASANKAQGNVTATDGISSADGDYDIDVYAEKMTEVLTKILKISEENGVQPIILLHERFSLDENGGIVMEKEAIYKDAFINCCEDVGVKVVDAVPAMIDHYKKNIEFPYGFSNTIPGQGHLNKTGHEIIAEVLYDKINEMEEKNDI